MMMNSKKDTWGGEAFSLIEMMVVLGVVAILLAFAAPNLFSLISSSTLSSESTVVQNQLTLAQQTAISKSADVEVRFFKITDDSAALEEGAFRAFQLYQYDRSGNMIPISEFYRIRTPVAIHDKLSTLVQPSGGGSAADRDYGFDSPREVTSSGDDPNSLVPVGSGGAKEFAPYVAFRFRPDGSTDLPYRSGQARDTWYLTLVQGEGALQNNRPDNYVCLQVNPYNGKINVFRP